MFMKLTKTKNKTAWPPVCNGNRGNDETKGGVAEKRRIAGREKRAEIKLLKKKCVIWKTI